MADGIAKYSLSVGYLLEAMVANALGQYVSAGCQPPAVFLCSLYARLALRGPCAIMGELCEVECSELQCLVQNPRQFCNLCAHVRLCELKRILMRYGIVCNQAGTGRRSQNAGATQKLDNVLLACILFSKKNDVVGEVLNCAASMHK